MNGLYKSLHLCTSACLHLSRLTSGVPCVVSVSHSQCPYAFIYGFIFPCLLVASCLPVLICGIRLCVGGSPCQPRSAKVGMCLCTFYATILACRFSVWGGLPCLTDFSSSSVSCGWMQTIHFLAGGVLWAWAAVTRSSHPCFECEVWLAVPLGTTSLCVQSSAIALS